MLHVLIPSGEELAAIPAPDVSTVRNLKHDLHKISGVPRFRQKILHEGKVLEEDVHLDASMESVLLVFLAFCDASEEEIQEFVLSPCQGSVDEVEKLLQRSMDPNAATADGRTALMLASCDGYPEIAQLLLEARADMDVADHDGTTALVAASRDGEEDMVRWFLDARADINKADGHSCTPLVNALQEGQLNIASLLVQAGAGTGPGPQGNELLCTECQCADASLEIVRLLLEARVDANTATDEGMTALTVACDEGHLEIVEMLLTSRADANHSNNNGLTALFLAARSKHVEILRLLLRAGADPDQEIMETSALSHAIFWDSVEVVRWLLHARAAVDKANQDGATPLNTACSWGNSEVVRLVVQAVVDRVGLVELDRVDNCGGYTALHCAAIQNFLPIASLLVKAGASKDIEDDRGNLPLDYAQDDDMAKLLATERPSRTAKGEGE